MQAQQLAGALGIAIQIEGRQKDPVLADRALAEFVEIVPSEVHAVSHLAKHGRVLVSNSNLKGLGLLHTVHFTSAEITTQGKLRFPRYPSRHSKYGAFRAIRVRLYLEDAIQALRPLGQKRRPTDTQLRHPDFAAPTCPV
ncbi:hypothetical protein D3C80_1785220 [compost metagenome]